MIYGRTIIALLSFGLSLPMGCSEAVGGDGHSTTGASGESGSAGTTNSGGAGGVSLSGGELLVVPVQADRATYVKLDPPGVITAPTDETGTGWDLSFQGFDIHTNSGPSGPGRGAGFGPLDPSTFLGENTPSVPFTIADTTGGAFTSWYAYEGAPAHVLWSRYHTVLVQDGERIWKVQVLGYYGQQLGAPVSAMYSVRYAEITDEHASATITLTDIDATAGGVGASDEQPSECLDLASGNRPKLTTAQAQQSNDWHLCFRRENIHVNGELGGTRGVGAVDLRARETSAETLEQIKARTSASELAAFDAVSDEDAEGQQFRGDRIVSVFDGSWLNKNTVPPTPTTGAWLVVGADGQSHFLVVFEGIEDSTTTSLGSVQLRIKPVH